MNLIKHYRLTSFSPLLVLSLVLACIAISPATEAVSISIDHVDGMWGTDSVLSSRPVIFHVRLTNDDMGAPVAGHTNGFRLYSPDGAVWSPAVGDTVSLGWPNIFDLVWEIMPYSTTGAGADTIGFGGARQDSTGLPDGFDQVAWTVSTQLSAAQDGLTLCLDSAFFPPSGWWQWSYGGSIGRQYPDWDGPYCLTIVSDHDADSVPDIYDNCPYSSNSDQVDNDIDGVGDVCDNCPFTPNSDQTDSDSDNVGDACRGAYVEPGDSVTVNLTDSLSITFDSVITGGVTEVDTSSGGPPPPDGFRLVPNSPPVYYEITTSAEYVPPVTICFTYDESEIHVPEHKLRIFHREGDPSVWQDVTVSVDTAANVICCVVSSLSPFVLAVPYCCFLRGDIDHSGVAPVDIADLVYLVDYMFNQGPVPECFDEGYIDGSGVEPIDIADLVYLVDYMFNGGPEPPPCP